MAVYLYRLGRLAARRAWAVVLVWILVVAAVGGAAAALQKPFTSKLSIPGTEFQQVLDDLDRSLPDAAGGSAGVVFSTKDGAPFTQEQKNAVARVTKAWSGIQGVDEASNPFATQQDLDEGRSDLAEGKTKLADAEKEIRDNAKKIADGKVEIADGRAKIDENADKLADGERQLDEGAAQLADGEAAIVANARKLEQGRAELERNQAKIDDGKKQLAAGRAELDAGQRKLDAGKAQLADGEKQLAAARAKVEAGEKQLAPAQAKIAAGRKQIAAARAELADARSRLEAGRAQVAAQRAELEALKNETDAPTPTDGDPSPSPSATDAPTPTPSDDAPSEEPTSSPTSTPTPTSTDSTDSTEAVTGAVGVLARVAAAPDPERIAALEAQIAAATERLDASEAEITRGEQALQQQSAQLDAGAAQLKQQSAPLVAARRTLDQKTAELAAGKGEIAANQRKIDAGRATLREKTAELTAGERKLQAGWTQLRDGEAQLAAGRKKLDAGKAEIAANRAKLSSGKAQLAQGRVDLDAAAKQLKDGEAKLSDGRTTIAEKKVELRQGERRLALMDGLRSVSKDGHVAMANVSFDAPLNEVPQSTKDELPASAGALDAAGVRVDYSKDIAESISVGGASEIVGIVLAAIVLIVMLGSLLAAGLPLLIAMIGVGTGVAGMLALTHWVEMTDVTPALAVMLGLAVGIDYALFIVHRHRQTLASGEVDVQESIGRAVGTAGSAVLFAGMTVVVALAALTVTGIPFLGVMGLAAAATVATSVLVALTLTPALLSLMGPRVLSPKARRALKESWAQEESEADAEDAEEAGEPAASRAAHHAARGRGWGGLVTRHPVIAVAASVLLLGLVALPAASLKLGLPDASQEAHDSTAYRTYSTISQAFGPGQNAAILAVAKVDPAQADAMTDDQVTELQLTVAEELKAHDDVEYVVPAAVSDDHRTLVYQIVPGSGPNDDATQQLIHELRDERGQVVDATAVDSIGFAGQTVANIDMSELLADALPKYLAVVVGISILLLLLVFRSVIVPLLATGGFLLSVAASFGAVVAVYQWGWLGSVFGVSQPGVILSFLPTLVIGILFGLAMDYQMFLVSGMREAWAHGHAARTAVRTGFSHGAKVVTAAALIMVGVFAGFVHAPSAMIRPIGFALAAGVIFDAFVVRMTIMPALMHLLGERAWYLPAWLGRILPDLDVEGTKLLAQRAADEQATLEEQGRDREPSTV